MKPYNAKRLYATGKESYPHGRYVITNNPDLAEKELKRQGFPVVDWAESQTAEGTEEGLQEMMYFDDEGNIVPIEKLLEPNNYK